MTNPIIGVTPSGGINALGVRAYSLAADYTQAIERAGGIPVIVPLHIKNIHAVLETLDGIVFSGGGDIDPALFSQEKHESVDYVDPERDAFELDIMQEAFARDMPILAICRGVQVMNVQQGGTLIQDILSQTESTKEHAQRNQKMGEYDTFDEIVIPAGNNPVSRAMGAGNVSVNSFHHQALGDVADSLDVIATSEDGIIEAVYAPGRTHAVGTQWHPERLAAAHAEHQALFNDLIEAARNYRTVGAKTV